MARLTAAWTAVTNALSLAVIWVICLTEKLSPGMALLVLASGQILPGGLTQLTVRRRLGWRKIRYSETEAAFEFRKLGLPIALPGLAGAGLNILTPILINYFGGAGACADYGVLQRLFGLALQGHALLLGPFWPAYTDAATNGDTSWIRQALRLSLLVTAALSATILAASAVMPQVLKFWIGPEASLPAKGFIMLMTLTTITGLFSQTISLFLLGLGRLQEAGARILMVQLTTAVLMAAFGWRWQQEGVLLALALGGGIGMIPILIRDSRTALVALGRNPEK
jgi:O-antigen/teichoic acid export membrane protein